jgi:hypothetical protein
MSFYPLMNHGVCQIISPFMLLYNDRSLKGVLLITYVRDYTMLLDQIQRLMLKLNNFIKWDTQIKEFS